MLIKLFGFYLEKRTFSYSIIIFNFGLYNPYLSHFQIQDKLTLY